MVRSRPVIVIAGAVALLAVSISAGAADPISYRPRQDRYEFTLQPRYLASKTIDFDGGTSIDTDADLGFGFGFGYNFTNKIAMHLDWSWASANYKARIGTTDSGGISTTRQRPAERSTLPRSPST